MAHLEKYKATSVGHMLAHYRRDPSSLGRENIDPARVGMDYTLALDPADGLVKPMEGVEPNWATVEERIERVNERAKAEGKRAVRKDAVGRLEVAIADLSRKLAPRSARMLQGRSNAIWRPWRRI